MMFRTALSLDRWVDFDFFSLQKLHFRLNPSVAFKEKEVKSEWYSKYRCLGPSEWIKTGAFNSYYHLKCISQCNFKCLTNVESPGFFPIGFHLLLSPRRFIFISETNNGFYLNMVSSHQVSKSWLKVHCKFAMLTFSNSLEPPWLLIIRLLSNVIDLKGHSISPIRPTRSINYVLRSIVVMRLIYLFIGLLNSKSFLITLINRYGYYVSVDHIFSAWFFYPSFLTP